MKKMSKMTGNERELVRKNLGVICKVIDCNRGVLIVKSGYCGLHHYRDTVHGSPFAITNAVANTYFIDGDIAKIALRNKSGKIVDYAICDTVMLPKIKQHKWCRTRAGYAQTTIKSTRKPIFMHRLILGEDYPQVDHINRNGLDNRLANLRGCNTFQNNRNRLSKSTTGYRGVHHSGSRINPYIVRVWYNGDNINIGLFKDVLEAAHIYNTCLEQLMGNDYEFAISNKL